MLTSKSYSVKCSMGDLKKPLVGKTFVHFEHVEVRSNGFSEQAIVSARLGLGVDGARSQPACARARPQPRGAGALPRRSPLALRTLVHDTLTHTHTTAAHPHNKVRTKFQQNLTLKMSLNQTKRKFFAH